VSEVGKEELLRILQIFKKEEIPRLYGLSIELFLSFYDFIVEYL
jgi:hypothetical protein